MPMNQITAIMNHHYALFVLMLAGPTFAAAQNSVQRPADTLAQNVKSHSDSSLPESLDALCARSPEVCDTNRDHENWQWHPPREKKPGFFAWGADLEDYEWPLRTNGELIHNRIFMISHAIWLGSNVYDIEATHQGLAHHKCVEGGGSGGLGGLGGHGEDYPSRGGLYLDSLEEVAPLLAWDILMTKFLWQPEGEIAPVWASIVHFRAGSKWITQCW